MKIERLNRWCVQVRRYEDPSPGRKRVAPDTRYDATLILSGREPGERGRVTEAMIGQISLAGQIALAGLVEPGTYLFQRETVRHQLWPMADPSVAEGVCHVIDLRRTYYYAPNQILAVHVLFARDARGGTHTRITVGSALAGGQERDRPAQPFRRTLAPTGEPLQPASRWCLFYPELSASLYGGSSSPDVCTLWRHLKDDPTDALAWDALADAMEEEGLYEPGRERRAARLIREGLLAGCNPVDRNQRHPALLWPGQVVKP